MVVRTEPEPFAMVTDLRGRIRFHFDERISESVAGGTLEDAVTVSPRSGELDVSHDSRTLSVQVEGGLRPGVVYRVTLLPVVRDLFGNQLQDPFELVFSTGGEPAPTTIAGEVWDRITGQGLRSALVHAVGPDSLVHVARTDDQGIFAFRYLPAGDFLLTGFEDVDRDGEVDAREVKGYLAATIAQGDTLLVEVPVLAPDTTAAVLARATALDSLTVVLEFDDYVDPGSDASGVQVELAREGILGPEVSRLFHEHEYAAYVERVADSLSVVSAPTAAAPAAPTDSVARDTVAARPDSVAGAAAPADTAVVTPGAPRTVGRPAAGAARRGPPPLPGGRGAGQARSAALPPGRVLPGRRLVALLEEPLEVAVELRVQVGSVVNINGLDGGGGEATLLLEAPPPPPADTTTVPDSTAAPDSVPPPVPDTGAAPPGAARPGGGS